jgi:predicted TIM-barrel fold metal-dependent hydrolase
MTQPQIISVDDHVVEPKNLWTSRLPAKFQEIGPRVVRGGQPGATSVNARGLLVHEDSGEGLPTDWWQYEDVRMPIFRSFAGVSFASREDIDRTGMTYDEMRPGCYDAGERLKDMTAANIEASICFPNLLPRFCGQSFLWSKDKELADLSVKAYNDWVIDEWCAPSGGRLIPLSILQLWDADLAAQEIYRNAARGARAISFSENPTAIGLPSIHDADRYWDPVFRACAETKTVMCIHIGSSSQMPKTAPDAPQAVRSTIVSNNAQTCMSDWLFSGNFVRFPDLKIALSEAEIGWMPYILERVDRVWHTRLNYYDRAAVPNPPSTYFRSNMYGCMVSDQHGIDAIDAIGEDNILFEVDYPHSDSTWPDTPKIAEKELAKLTPVQREKVLRGNAIKLFNLDL